MKTAMIRFISGLIALCLAGTASAQQYMTLPPGTIMANTSTQTNAASAVPIFPDFVAALARLGGTGTGMQVFGTAPNITTPTGIVKGDVGLGNVANVDTTNASNISSGTLAAGRMPALTGDCTTSAGAVATNCLKTNGVAFAAGATAVAGQLPGTGTNDSASAGNVGQYISSNVVIGSAVSLTTGVAANITSISLTIGDWDVSGMCAAAPNGATTSSLWICNVNTVSATLNTVPSDANALGVNASTTPAGGNNFMPTSTGRFSLSGPTTLFLVVQSSFAVNTMGAFGTIRARRIR